MNGLIIFLIILIGLFIVMQGLFLYVLFKYLRLIQKSNKHQLHWEMEIKKELDNRVDQRLRIFNKSLTRLEKVMEEKYRRWLKRMIEFSVQSMEQRQKEMEAQLDKIMQDRWDKMMQVWEKEVKQLRVKDKERIRMQLKKVLGVLLPDFLGQRFSRREQEEMVLRLLNKMEGV